MRFVFLRSLVLLLTLAIVSGNAHAQLHPGAAHHEPCPETGDHHHAGTNAPHQRHHNAADSGCCCDCFGCVSAVSLTLDRTSFVPVFLADTVRYGDEHPILAGRGLRPDPDPPRTSALT
jgi:hypothetical protein